ncbi:MAG: hypothetical protein AB1516_13540 [Pseudomonadota bacterium]
MQTWPVQDAKARFSELLDTCLRDGPHAVSRRGEEQAVRAWIKNIPEHLLYLSVFTLTEIQSGIERTREQDRSKTEEIEQWLNKLQATSKTFTGLVYRY